MTQNQETTANASPFDSIEFYKDGELIKLSYDEFITLPLNARIKYMLDSKTNFYIQDEKVDRIEALSNMIDH